VTWVSELLKGVSDGEKHKACIRLAAYFSFKGLPIDITKSILLEWNSRNVPPADASGIIGRVEDVYKRYPSTGRGVLQRGDNVQGAHTVSASITTPKTAYAGFKEELRKGAKTIATEMMAEEASDVINWVYEFVGRDIFTKYKELHDKSI